MPTRPVTKWQQLALLLLQRERRVGLAYTSKYTTRILYVKINVGTYASIITHPPEDKKKKRKKSLADAVVVDFVWTDSPPCQGPKVDL